MLVLSVDELELSVESVSSAALELLELSAEDDEDELSAELELSVDDEDFKRSVLTYPVVPFTDILYQPFSVPSTSTLVPTGTEAIVS